MARNLAEARHAQGGEVALQASPPIVGAACSEACAISRPIMTRRACAAAIECPRARPSAPREGLVRASGSDVLLTLSLQSGTGDGMRRFDQIMSTMSGEWKFVDYPLFLVIFSVNDLIKLRLA